jgi:hypothetical protein
VQIPPPNGVRSLNVEGPGTRVTPHEVLATYSQNIRFTGQPELVLPPVDDSAVFLLKFDDSAGGRWFGEIVSFNPNTVVRGRKDPQRTSFEIPSRSERYALARDGVPQARLD